MRFGWCLDGHHENCREKVPAPGGTATCECPCHKLPRATIALINKVKERP